MVQGATVVWATIATALDVTSAIALASVALILMARPQRFGRAGGLLVTALGLTALSCVGLALSASSPEMQIVASVFGSLRNVAWLAVIYRLFASDGREENVAPIRPVIFALGFVECLHLMVNLGVYASVLPFSPTGIVGQMKLLLRLLVSVGGLVLVHNLYVGAQSEARGLLRWPAIGLAVLWAFELNLYTIAYLSTSWPVEMAALRGLSTLVLAICMGIGTLANRQELRIRPSRAVTFQTFSLLVIGIYLVGMVALAQWLFYAGGNFTRLLELVFITLASAVALVILPSRKVRSWIKVNLAKHFFQHRYDYREEWLRFTNTIGRGGEQSTPLGERVVQSVADVFDSPAGLLLTPAEQGEMRLAARWNWPEIDVPAEAVPVSQLEPFENSGFIADLDEIRSVKAALQTERSERGKRLARRRSDAVELHDEDVPAWLLDHPRAWVLIPLLHYERLVGMVVLARPQVSRALDWEDFDLLRVMGQQVASYLSENASQQALAESARFEDFHRRIAFVMHDIKNLASQFSLLARNAELYAEKPAFRADMLVTLRNSSDKLNALLARLSRYSSGAVERLEVVSTKAVMHTVTQRFAATGQVHVTQNCEAMLTANGNSLEHVLVHLLQNAIDASEAGQAVHLGLEIEDAQACFIVTDQGHGMSAEFVRNSLFKPFVSTKSGGFGIGAFEARELVKAMRGRLDVESREGAGSRFTVRLPLAPDGLTGQPADQIDKADNSHRSEQKAAG